jgi:hypothetical protein
VVEVKVIALILIIVIIILGTGFWMENYLTASSEMLAANFEKLEEALTRKNWVQASEILNNTWEIWDKTKKNWAPLIDHQEIDQLDLAVARLTQYINNQEYSLSLAELSALKFLIRHIPEKERVNLQNIF